MIEMLASIIICTKDRPNDLTRCLKSLSIYLSRKDLEVIVVDNNSSSNQTREIVEGYPQIRYLMESRPGQGFAKNTGILAANGKYIIFTDDDVIVQKGWIENLLSNFTDEKIAYVSGQVEAWIVSSDSQQIFEDIAILSKGSERKTFDTEFFNRFRLRGVPVHLVAMGANSVAPKHVLLEVGLHDPLFGVGSLVGGGETGELCYKILQKGYTAVFDPNALIKHRHPTTRQALRKRMFTYGKADTAIQAKFFIQYHDWRGLADIIINRPYRQIKKFLEMLCGKNKTPLDLIFFESIGNWIGPFSYLRALILSWLYF